MDTVCLPSSAWLSQRENSLRLLARAAGAHRPGSVSLHIDWQTATRELAVDAQPAMDAVHEIAFSTWTKNGLTEDGVLDVERVRTAPQRFPERATVVVNAVGFKSEIVSQALFQTRIAFYPLPSWPRLFVLIVDDAQLFQITKVLANTFYIQPEIKIPTAIEREVRQHRRNASILRVFGRYYIISVVREVFTAIDKLLTKREQKATRGLGWTWEE